LRLLRIAPGAAHDDSCESCQSEEHKHAPHGR
jgi:hypothetical protein